MSAVVVYVFPTFLKREWPVFPAPSADGSQSKVPPGNVPVPVELRVVAAA
jgi:hypothetical protein